jgi:phage terminase Nu1 subunit (DNA packaging protein)
MAELLQPSPAIPASVTGPELADLLGVSGKTVRELAGRGIVVRARRGAYELRASVRGYAEHLRSIATGKAGGEAVAAGAAAARKRLAEAQADKVEIANAHARGALVDAEAVQREWSEVLRMVRAGMLAVPSRCGARLPHLSAHDVGEIDVEVRAVLTEVGSGDGVQHPG